MPAASHAVALLPCRLGQRCPDCLAPVAGQAAGSDMAAGSPALCCDWDNHPTRCVSRQPPLQCRGAGCVGRTLHHVCVERACGEKGELRDLCIACARAAGILPPPAAADQTAAAPRPAADGIAVTQVSQQGAPFKSCACVPTCAAPAQLTHQPCMCRAHRLILLHGKLINVHMLVDQTSCLLSQAHRLAWWPHASPVMGLACR